jgi:hypothetical protein
MASSGMLRRVALVRTDVSEELISSIIRVTIIGELGTLAVTSNRRTLRRNTKLKRTVGTTGNYSSSYPFKSCSSRPVLKEIIMNY